MTSDDPAGALRGAVGQRAGLQVHVDDEVDGRGDRPHGVVVGDVRAGLHRAGDELADGGLGVGGVRGGDGPGAGLHRLDHRQDLLAADLADDLPGEVEPEGVEQRLVEGELAGLPPVRRRARPTRAGPPTRRRSGAVSVSSCRCSSYSVSKVPIASCRRDLGAQGPHQRRLARALRARRRRWTCGPGPPPAGTRPPTRRQRAPLDEVVQGDLPQPVPADHHRRARRHPRGRGQPGAAVEAQVQPRLGLGERARVDLDCVTPGRRGSRSAPGRSPRPAGRARSRPSVSSRVTWSWPVMMMFSTRSSSTSGCSRPSPNSASSSA